MMYAKILIIDDSLVIRIKVRQILESDQDSNFIIHACEDGERAIQYLRKCASYDDLPDVIILDRNMPNMDGDKCIRLLKLDKHWRLIQVLFLTVQGKKTEIVKGLTELKADDYLTKPFNDGEMLARVKALIRIKRAEDQIRALNKKLKKALVAQKQSYDELKKTKIKLAETQGMAIMTKVFEKFVPKQFLQRIAKQGIENIKVGCVDSSMLTILFSDIRSFTQISESTTPEKVFSFLNNYLSYIQVAIDNHGGFIDKFMGDALMALFNGTMQLQVNNAIKAAIEMQTQLKIYNKELSAQGKFPIKTGIGIHIGHVMIGTLGNENRMDITVIGDAVNVASRIEGLTKYYDSNIIISDKIYKLLNTAQYCIRELDYIRVKGRDKPTKIYEIFDNDPEPIKARKKNIFQYNQQGFQYYRNRQWKNAIKSFQQALDIYKNDKVSSLFIKRSKLYLQNPPQGFWDGAFTMQNK